MCPSTELEGWSLGAAESERWALRPTQMSRVEAASSKSYEGHAARHVTAAAQQVIGDDREMARMPSARLKAGSVVCAASQFRRYAAPLKQRQ